MFPFGNMDVYMIKSSMKLRTFLNLLVWIVLTVYMWTVWDTVQAPMNWAHTVSIMAIVLFVYQMVCMRKMKVKYYDFRIWFISLQYIFIFGRVFLHGFNLDGDIFWNLFTYYEDTSLYKAAVYGLVFIQSLFLGLFWKPHKIEKSQLFDIFKIKDKYSGSCMRFIGCAMVILSLPFRLMNDYSQIKAQSANSGYIALANTNGMTYALGMLLPIGVVFLICSDAIKRKNVNKILFVFSAYSVAVMILSGDRRYVITSFISIILCYMKRFDIKLNWKRIVPLGIVAVLALSMLEAIRNGRMQVIDSFGTFWDLFIESLTTSNIIYETFAEFGLTYFIYAAGIQFFPSVFSYKMGMTYLLGPLTAIPMSGMIFPGMLLSISAHWDCKSITGHSLGAALGEEVYCNFGLLAPFFAVIIGFVISRIMHMKRQDSPYETAKYYGMFYLLLNLVRSSSVEILRTAVYALILPMFFGFVYKRLTRKAW
ncbi:MAG: O-antigen polysaccharide polymerase Wzy [Hominimerdicola sp.]